MVMKFTNNATTTLAGGITNVATTLTVATGTGTKFPTLAGGDYFYCTLANLAGTVEIIKVTAISGDTFTTIVRAQDGTSAISWNTGDKVELRLVAASLNDIPKKDESNTFTGTQTVQAAATQDAVAIAGRAGGTSSFAATITPTTLTASRTITIPDATDTVAVLNAVQTLTNKTLLASGSNTVEATSGPSSSPFSFRNRFINGGIQIDQRNGGAAQTITAGAALAYTVDRWYAYCTGANVTGQRAAGTHPNQYNYQFTGAASVTKIGFAQRIEAANCQDLAGQTATLAVDLANSLLTTVTWTAWYANTSNAFGTLASPTRTQIATGTFTVNSTLARYSTQISIPAAATTGIEVEFSVGAQTSGTFTIGRAQFEAGVVATPFEVRLTGELALCQQYLPAIQLNTGFFSGGQVFTSTDARIALKLPVTARTAPTGFSLSTGTLAFSNAAGASTGSAVFSTASADYIVLATSGASGLVSGNATSLIPSSALLILPTGCEL